MNQESTEDKRQVTLLVDVQLARDVLSNCVEVASGYWLGGEDTRHVKVGRSENFGKGNVPLHEWYYTKVSFESNHDGEEYKKYEVTPDKLLECMGAFLRACPHFAHCYVGEEYEGDAESDDAWFQFAAFGDVVYG